MDTMKFEKTWLNFQKFEYLLIRPHESRQVLHDFKLHYN